MQIFFGGGGGGGGGGETLSGQIQKLTSNIFLIFFSSENRIWHLTKIVSFGDNLYKMSLYFLEK